MTPLGTPIWELDPIPLSFELTRKVSAGLHEMARRCAGANRRPSPVLKDRQHG